jgi:hypothetical protein
MLVLMRRARPSTRSGSAGTVSSRRRTAGRLAAIGLVVVAGLASAIGAVAPATAVAIAAATAPAVVDVTPGVGRPGQTSTFRLTGSDFTAKTTVSFGPGTTVASVTLVSASALDVVVAFAANAAAGTRDISVQDPPGPVSTLTDAIAVRSPVGEFHPLTPDRLLDTRLAGQTRVGEDETRLLTVTGVGGVPANGIAAVVLNVTATEASAATYVTVFPAGAARPEASNLNLDRNETIPNLVTVAVGTNGQVALYNHSGQVQLVVDVAGWYGTATAEPGAAFVPSSAPIRLLDTRIDGKVPLGPDESLSLKVTTPGTAVAAAFNVTATQPSAATYLTIWPSDATRPVASNLNVESGQTIPNMVIVRLGADGTVRIYNHSGSAHVVVDLLGVFRNDAIGVLGGQFEGTVPKRILDTRTNVGGFGGAPIGAASKITVAVGGVSGVPVHASSVVVNVTATDPTAEGYLVVWPSDLDRPTASNLNMVPGKTAPNLVVVPLAPDGTVDVFNQAGTTHVIFDIVGWYR